MKAPEEHPDWSDALPRVHPARESDRAPLSAVSVSVVSSIVRRVVIAGLRFYKRYVSPVLPPACRFSPSCSEYASEAIERYGVTRGSWRALRRLLKCHPLHPGGFDPVQ